MLVYFLVSHYNINVNTVDSSGKTPLLHLLSEQPGALHISQQNTLQRLLKLGANVNSADREGFTPLHHAVAARDLEATKLLYEYGADSLLKTKKLRHNPIVHALTTSPGENQAVSFLMVKQLNLTEKPQDVPIKPNPPSSTAVEALTLSKRVMAQAGRAVDFVNCVGASMKYDEEKTKVELVLEDLSTQEIVDQISVLPSLVKVAQEVPAIMEKNTVYREELARLEQEISALDIAIKGTSDVLEIRALSKERTEKADLHQDTILAMNSDLSKTTVGIVRHSVGLFPKGLTAIADAALQRN